MMKQGGAAPPALWAGYRRVKRRLIVLALGWIPFAYLFLEISDMNPRLWPIIFLLGAYFVYLMITLIQFQLSRCPNCHVPLFGGLQLFPRQCRGCGIRINKDSEAPTSFSRRLGSSWKVIAVAFVGLFISIWIIVGLFVMWAASQMRSSDATKLTIATAEASPALTEELGQPLKIGRLISGYVDDSAGRAEVEVPVSGPRGNGVLYAKLRKQSGAWQIQLLTFRGEKDAANLDLLPVQNQNSKAPPR
jgi:hypothetical protein